MNALPLKENLKKYTNEANCHIRNVISHYTSKGGLLILFVLSENELTRFSEIGRAIPDLSPKVLSSTLKRLETDGLIVRKVYPEVPPRVEYALTSLGMSLIPVLESLVGWAVENYDGVTGCRRGGSDVQTAQ